MNEDICRGCKHCWDDVGLERPGPPCMIMLGLVAEGKQTVQDYEECVVPYSCLRYMEYVVATQKELKRRVEWCKGCTYFKETERIPFSSYYRVCCQYVSAEAWHEVRHFENEVIPPACPRFTEYLIMTQVV